MKKSVLLVLAVAAMSFSSCKTLLSTATTEDAKALFLPTVTIADVEVSSEKLTYLYVPTKMVAKGGRKNIISTAVREALQSAGDYDVLIGKETQIKCGLYGRVRSVLVTGFPGKYVNFRSSEELVGSGTFEIYYDNELRKKN